MENLKIQYDLVILDTFSQYPPSVRPQMLRLRELILEVANDLEEVSSLEETLKWGEPAYLTKHGSTIRIDWKEKTPDQYAMYFKCTSKLVPSFREVFGDLFTFEDNRAIVFKLNEPIPEPALKQCIAAGLRYHKLKHLPLLGL